MSKVLLHPLALINIADHFTRQKVRSVPESDRSIPLCVGVLFGSQTPGTDSGDLSVIEIHTSFEIVAEMRDGVCQIDSQYLCMKRDQYLQIFPKYEVVGWYSTHTDVVKSQAIYDQFVSDSIAETPLSLLLDPTFSFEGSAVSRASSSLPLFIFEPKVSGSNPSAPTPAIAPGRVDFGASVPYSIVSGDAERVGVEHISAAGGAERTRGTKSQVVSALAKFRASFRILQDRVQAIVSFLSCSVSGSRSVSEKETHAWMASNASLLRRCSLLAHQMHSMGGSAFDEDFSAEVSSVLLEVLCASMTHAVVHVDSFLKRAVTSSLDVSQQKQGAIDDDIQEMLD
eukprot:ANDGO_05822.mRNA.1 COP9 signalosome complex subunit 6